MELIARKKRAQRLVLLAMLAGSACAWLSGTLAAIHYNARAAVGGSAR